MYEQLNSHYNTVNVLFQDADYVNDHASSSRHHRDPHYYIKNSGELIEQIKLYYKNGEKRGNNFCKLFEPLHWAIINKIDQKEIEGPPSEEDKEPAWRKVIEKIVYKKRYYMLEKDDINSPISILENVFKNHLDQVAVLKNKFKSTYEIGLFEFYLEKQQLEGNSLDNTKKFFDFMNSKSSDELLESYIQEKLDLKAPWEEINEILERHGFQYWYKANEGSNSNTKNFVLTKQVGGLSINIEPGALSSGEKVALGLLSQLFYFRGISAEGKNPAETPHLDVMLLDEPDRHLDPELCKKMYEIIYQEFVKKHHVQVFMTTHRPDAVFFAPDNSIYTLGEGSRLIIDPAAAINRMTSNMITPAPNQRSAASMLSGGKLAVFEDVSYVLAENEDDVKFYNIIYQKLKSGYSGVVANKTQLIFMPVGIKLDAMKKDKETLQDKVDELGKMANELAQDLSGKENLNKRIKSLKEGINDLAKGINDLAVYEDGGGGRDAVIKKVNNIPVYQGEYDTYGKVKAEGYLKELINQNHRQNVFLGVIDSDKSIRTNKRGAEGMVHALNAYSFENYLCMPLNLFYYIKKYMPTAYSNFNFSDYQGIDQDQLQRIFKGEDENFEQGRSAKEELQQISEWVDKYLEQQLDTRKKELTTWVKGKLSSHDKSLKSKIKGWTKAHLNKTYNMCQIFSNKQTDQITLIGEQTINYRKPFFTKQGHELIKIMYKLMPDHRNKQPDDTLFKQFMQYLSPTADTSIEKQEIAEFFKMINQTFLSEEKSEKEMEKKMTERLLKAFEEIPVAYLPKSLWELIERLQNAEEVRLRPAAGESENQETDP
ncbi:hypothetical protein DICPUDRAFT_75661 [Dictyostelium purpureum]|uniref:ATPase AAA-type core domain-containing protein n=1 Tax=Dictyostelium purpureum TaxID=5786 RepID=F0ZBB0_DICPU|nr:uncharacterized protein DICPUDRAFT_75661 [Dictyostelium purpureum]EGC38789.1 hypothetical protein DICPUDRAFT_75661 [Dictyostelium purpureum]|eukprot:XP_003284683.1 hypothetical protein DICPUDRAFT_75661 [Dictyostelium purpureum]